MFLPRKNNKGFTLIELLVTISILAVLMTISVGAFRKLQENSRDAKRQSDLATIQAALEQYHADQTYYPPTGAVVPGASLTSPSGVTPAKTYLNKIPQDPDIDFAYQYTSSGTCGAGTCSYCLYARMENEDNNNDITTCGNSTLRKYEVSSP